MKKRHDSTCCSSHAEATDQIPRAVVVVPYIEITKIVVTNVIVANIVASHIAISIIIAEDRAIDAVHIDMPWAGLRGVLRVAQARCESVTYNDHLHAT